MRLICPNCRGELQPSAAGGAVCAQHGGRYQVLFNRSAIAAESAAGQPGAQSAVQSDPAGTPPEPAPGRALDWTAGPGLGPCADHPDVPAAVRCQLCAKAICPTCDFVVAGGVHLCPACVEQQSVSTDVSPKRKRLSYIALALAAWSTLLMVLLFAGAFNEYFTEDEGGKLADLVVTNLILWPLLIGVGVSLSALDRHLRSTPLMKAAVWWNGILGGIFLLIVIAANLGLIG